jgi:hypothetical protein
MSEDESDDESVDVIELSEEAAELSVLEASTLVELELEPWPPTSMPATIPCFPGEKVCGASLR